MVRDIIIVHIIPRDIAQSFGQTSLLRCSFFSYCLEHVAVGNNVLKGRGEARSVCDVLSAVDCFLFKQWQNHVLSMFDCPALFIQFYFFKINVLNILRD